MRWQSWITFCCWRRSLNLSLVCFSLFFLHHLWCSSDILHAVHLAELTSFPYLPGSQPVWWTESAWRGQISAGCSTGSWAAVGCWPESLSSNALVMSWEQRLLNLQLCWSQAWGFPSCWPSPLFSWGLLIDFLDASYLCHCFVSCLFSTECICSFNSICLCRIVLKPQHEKSWLKKELVHMDASLKLFQWLLHLFNKDISHFSSDFYYFFSQTSYSSFFLLTLLLCLFLLLTILAP